MGEATGSPVEVFDFGSKHAAQVGAVSSTVDDFSAGYYNPGGIAFREGKSFSFGLLASNASLKINERSVGIDQPFGLAIGGTIPAPFGGVLKDRLFFGLGLYLLPSIAVQVRARFPQEPFYPYYDNRTQRIVILPTLGIKILPNLSFGIGINFLGSLIGSVDAMEGSTRALEASVDQTISSLARVNAGVKWRFTKNIDFSFVFRQDFSIPFKTISKTMVAGEPININIEASGLFTPMTFVIGSNWHNRKISISGDLTWARWSQYPGPFVFVEGELPLVGGLKGDFPVVPYSDTLSLRIGSEGVISGTPTVDGIWLRGGYKYETSPIPSVQSGTTNLLDGPKHILGSGIGFDLPEFSGYKPRLDFHCQLQFISKRVMKKVLYNDSEEFNSFTSLRDEVRDTAGDPSSAGIQISNPGFPEIRSGGYVISGGFTLEITK